MLTTYTLKEGRNIEPVPAEVDASAVIVTGAGVADDTHVTTIVCRFSPSSMRPFPSRSTNLGSPAFNPLYLPVAVCKMFLAMSEWSISAWYAAASSSVLNKPSILYPRDFADGHAFVVLRNVEIFGGVIVFRDFGDVVTQSERYAISERFAGEVEFVVPYQSQFITLVRKSAAFSFGEAAPYTPGSVLPGTSMSFVSRIYKSPANVNRLLKNPRSRPKFP